jgi:BlaI family transcriptional regulator, penicillinase repressor
VRTLLNRLVKKGAIRAELVDGRNIYRAKVAQSQCVRQESRSFLNKVFGGDASLMLLHFVQSEKLTPEQINELKALLNAKRGETK